MTRWLLIALLLWPTMLGAAGFRESVTCTVEGYVYAMPGEAPTFTRADMCTGVKWRIEDNGLLLYSPQSWVLIVLPARTDGQVRLLYRWGQPMAHIGPQDWPVAYGQIVKG